MSDKAYVVMCENSFFETDYVCSVHKTLAGANHACAVLQESRVSAYSEYFVDTFVLEE